MIPPDRGPGRPRDRVPARLGVDPAGPAVLPVPRAGRDARPASGARRVPGQVPGRLRRWLGRGQGAHGSPGSKSWACSQRRPQLAPRNPGVEAWADLPENHRRLAARLQEAFAAFLEHTDVQIGRLVAALEHLGQLDNTLILLLSDNGASQEGGEFGVLHEWKYFNFVAESPDDAVGQAR